MVNRSIFGLALAGWVSMLAHSCRTPTTRITTNPAAAIIYDPETDAGLGERFPLMKEINERYRTSLAEPVSVIAWVEDRSVSRVFYATNRIVADAVTDQWGNALAVGTCEVTLPRGQRGTANDGPSAAEKIRGLWSADSPKPKVAVSAPHVLPPDAFYGELCRTVERSPERDVLIFVHGFCVPFDASLARAAQLGIDLPFNGAVIAYSWPSRGNVKGYKTDEDIVAQSEAPFAQFLVHLDRALPPSTRIHILVHSMGNRLVLGGLNRLPDHFSNPPRFTNLILAAPDVGTAEFREKGAAAARIAQRTSLYVCDSDTALIASKGLHQMQRIGDAIPPVVVPGIETIDASPIETSFMGHSYYGSNRAALSDLFALIKENRGASQRSWLTQQQSDAGVWYRVTTTPTEVRWVWRFRHLQVAATPDSRLEPK